MKEESYPFSHTDQTFTFDFESIDLEKTIRKLIEISSLDHEHHIFNIALLDVLPHKTLSDLTVSNNSDLPQVLVTGFQALEKK